MSAKSAYIDSSFLVALLSESDVFHQNALQLIEEVDTAHMCMSLLTLDETIWSLRKVSSDKSIIFASINRYFDRYRTVKLLEARKSNMAAKAYVSLWQESGLKPRDCLHLFLMQENNIEIIASFDSDFSKHAKELKIKILGN